MRCNPLRWLWGLIPIALLTGVAVLSEHKRIEADLSNRVGQALTKAGLGWAASGFTGRDGALSGLAVEDVEPQRAFDIVRNVWGVRTVDNQTGLIERADTYVWSATLRDNRVRLAGFAPSEDFKKTIVGVAQATFPGREIQDQTKLARGAPPRDAWLGGVSFALKQLSSLKRGSVDLDGTSLTVDGEAEDTKSYRSVKSALANNLPQGVKLKLDKVRPPVVAPYTWSAAHNGKQVMLTGYVPSERARDDVFAAAKKAFPKAAVVDRMETASGEPRAYQPAAVAALAALASLEEGNAELKDTTLTLSGLAATDTTADEARRRLRGEAGGSLRVSDNLKVREVTPKPVSPFTTAVIVQEATVTLTGYVPSEPARTALIESAKARLPGKRIVDQLQLASGAPEGWQACTQAGLLGLGRLGSGRAQQTDRQLVITASTRDEALHEALPNDVRAAANRSCDTDARIELIARPEPNLSWRAQRSASEVVLDGEVPDIETKSELINLANRLFTKERIVDRMLIRPSVSTKWPKVADLGLRQLARLRTGEAKVSGQVLSVSGEAADATIASSVREQLGRALQPGYSGRDQIAVRSDAMIWAEEEARRKAQDEARRKIEDEARKVAEDQARRKAEDEARKAAEDQARRLAEDEARKVAEDQARRKAEDEARKAAEDQARRLAAEDQARRARAQEDARRRAEAESQRQAEFDARRRADAARCKSELASAAAEGRINFKRASAEIEPSSTATLDRLAEIARSCPNGRIEVEGHTDAEGTPERNQRLSQRRAQSVLEYLVRAGVDSGRIAALGYGAERPIAPNDTVENMAKNRRIQFEVRAE